MGSMLPYMAAPWIRHGLYSCQRSWRASEPLDSDWRSDSVSDWRDDVFVASPRMVTSYHPQNDHISSLQWSKHMAFDGYIMLYQKKNVYLQLDGEKPEISLVAELLDLFVDPFQSHVCCVYHPSKSSRGSSKVPFFFVGQSGTSGWWFGIWLFFSIDWEFHHPNSETPSFFTGVGSTTNQTSSNSMIHFHPFPSHVWLEDTLPPLDSGRSELRCISIKGMEPIYIYIYINPDKKIDMGMDQYLLIPFFRGMNIHLPAILMFTRGTRFWHTAIYDDTLLVI